MTEPSSTPPPPPPAAAPEPAAPLVTNAILPLMRLLPAPPLGAILTPPEPQDIRKPWFFMQVWAELRLAAQMYFDSRYRISRTAQLTFPLLAVLAVLNYFLLAHWFFLPIISPVAERLIDGALAVVAYRVLLRELDRYRTVLDYLSRFSHR
ncbi:hypothetical protein R5W23_000665 [Gemmata sp. JC673]|uniref:Uncharacterized protein n=1 Tax=Gemmata algarum TaxID=2975278 RepID=A0ABU5EXH8_9BACT|nr:hypothetical protein [Gemmata algarum]MDY3559654.1 hypothetical protein [Gemmata algarum]